MKKFLRPTILKIVLTIVIILIAFGGNILYSRNIVFTENGFKEPNLAIRTINYISNIIFYPGSFIVNFFVNKDFVNNLLINNSQGYMIFLFLFAFLLPVVIGVYLISCVVSYIILMFINRAK